MAIAGSQPLSTETRLPERRKLRKFWIATAGTVGLSSAAVIAWFSLGGSASERSDPEMVDVLQWEHKTMSSVIDIVFDRDVDGYEPIDRYSLACVYFEDEFKELATRLRVTPLTAFYSDDPDSLDDDFDEDYFGDPSELAALKEGWVEEFFDPADALKSVTALRDHLLKSPLKLKKPPSRGAKRIARELIGELPEIERSLNLANAHGARFHFVLTPD